jgi:hypothetical protein
MYLGVLLLHFSRSDVYTSRSDRQRRRRSWPLFSPGHMTAESFSTKLSHNPARFRVSR